MRTLELLDILGEAFEYINLNPVFCDTKKDFGLLKEKYQKYTDILKMPRNFARPNQPAPPIFLS
jgi:hypothetical protein